MFKNFYISKRKKGLGNTLILFITLRSILPKLTRCKLFLKVNEKLAVSLTEQHA